MRIGVFLSLAVLTGTLGSRSFATPFLSRIVCFSRAAIRSFVIAAAGGSWASCALNGRIFDFFDEHVTGLLSQFKRFGHGDAFGVALGAGQESGSASEQSSSEVEVLVDQVGFQHRGAFEWIGFLFESSRFNRWLWRINEFGVDLDTHRGRVEITLHCGGSEEGFLPRTFQTHRKPPWNLDPSTVVSRSTPNH